MFDGGFDRITLCFAQVSSGVRENTVNRMGLSTQPPSELANALSKKHADNSSAEERNTATDSVQPLAHGLQARHDSALLWIPHVDQMTLLDLAR